MEEYKYSMSSEMQPMLPHGNQNPSRTRLSIIKRMYYKFCSSRIGIRAVALLTVAVFIVAYFTLGKMHHKQNDIKLPLTGVFIPSKDYSTEDGGKTVRHAAELSEILSNIQAEEKSLSTSLFNSSMSKITFPSSPVRMVETDFKIWEILDTIKLPDPSGDKMVDFDDNVVKVRLTSRLKPKVWTRENKLKIFVVLHSHNDPGWLLPFKEYYKSQTKHILNYMLEYLSQDPQLKFIWCEISFFSLWWNELTNERRADVKKLVENKQLEFVGGGWVMPDEANVHYLSYFTQLIEGHQFLKEHLNYTVKNGWAIDPFGLSASLNFLQRQARINATAFTRIHYALKQYLRERKSVEFLWRQQWDSTGKSDIFSYLLPYYSYDASQTCGPEYKGICTNYKYSTAQRIPQNSRDILKQLKKKALIFKTNNLLWPVGGDFAWKTEDEWTNDLANLKSMIEYINSDEKLFTEIKFTTLNEYFQAIGAEIDSKNFKPPTISGDFFTYSGEQLDYWSGYFTSRIFHKTVERQLMSSVRSANLLFTLMTAELSKLQGSLNFPFVGKLLRALVTSRRTLSLFQHHDGITGTSKAKVVTDYALMLHDSLLKCIHVQQLSLFVLSNLKKFESRQYELQDLRGGAFYDPVMFKHHNNYWQSWQLSVINVDEATPLQILTVFNSLEVSVKQLVRVGVNTTEVKVVTLNDEEVESEVYPVFTLKEKSTKSSGAGINNQGLAEMMAKGHFQLYFVATLKPLEVKSYKIIYDSSRSSNKSKQIVNATVFNVKVGLSEDLKRIFNFPISQEPHLELSNNANIEISNDHFKLKFTRNGLAESVQLNGKEHLVNLTFRHYTSHFGSGVYSFVPRERNSLPVKTINPAIVVVQGNLQSYVEVWLPNVRHKLALYKTKGFEDYALNIENTIDITREKNYELVMRLSTNISSQDIFYTDSNGFQMMRRKTRRTMPTQGNFYPVASSAFIEDSKSRLTILTAQPGAGTSLQSGELEIVQDRIVHSDDGHGMGEWGNDNLRTTSKYKLLLEEVVETDYKPRSRENGAKDREFVPFLSMTAHHHLNSLLHPVRGFIMRKNMREVSFRNSSGSNNGTLGGSKQSGTPVIEGEEEKEVGKTLRGDLRNNSLEKPVLTDYSPGSDISSVSCDTFLATVHPLVKYKNSGEKNDTKIMLTLGNIGMIFHRVGFDGRFNSVSLLGRCSYNPESAGIVSINKIFKDLFENKYQKTSLSFVHVDEETSSDVIQLKPMNVQGLVANYKPIKEECWGESEYQT